MYIHVYSCIFMYIHVYSCIFKHIQAYSSICKHIHVYSSIFMYIHVYLHVYSCIFMYIHAYSCIFMHIHAYSCIFVYIYVYSCIFMYIHVYSCICIYTSKCKCFARTSKRSWNALQTHECQRTKRASLILVKCVLCDPAICRPQAISHPSVPKAWLGSAPHAGARLGSARPVGSAGLRSARSVDFACQNLIRVPRFPVD